MSGGTGGTVVEIRGTDFFVDGTITYPGTEAEGLLLNARTVNATFDDENPETRPIFAYPNGDPFDADRQTNEFIAVLDEYRAAGLLAVTLNFQGGRPAPTATSKEGKAQPWINTAFDADGNLKPAYLDRMARVLDALDRRGMVAIVGLFYFGQDQRLAGEAAVLNAVDNAVDWLLEQGYTNVIIEINNEVDQGYAYEILKRRRVHELIERVSQRSGGALPVSTSFASGARVPDRVIAASDYVLLHGNKLGPAELTEKIDGIRKRGAFRDDPKPIVVNEDSTSVANLEAAVAAGASWGYHDRGANDYVNGLQSPPTNWAINTPEKQEFFEAVRRLAQSE